MIDLTVQQSKSLRLSQHAPNQPSIANLSRDTFRQQFQIRFTTLIIRILSFLSSRLSQSDISFLITKTRLLKVESRGTRNEKEEQTVLCKNRCKVTQATKSSDFS